MNIPSTVFDDLNLDMRRMLGEAAIAHIDTGRRASLTLRVTVSRDRESGKRVVKARVSANLPEGTDDSRTRKGESVVLLSVSDDHPGQQRLDA